MLTPMALGQQFRVENAVYLDTENRPYSQSTTIFVDGKVYDYLHQPEEVVIFDPAERRFVFPESGAENPYRASPGAGGRVYQQSSFLGLEAKR